MHASVSPTTRAGKSIAIEKRLHGCQIPGRLAKDKGSSARPARTSAEILGTPVRRANTSFAPFSSLTVWLRLHSCSDEEARNTANMEVDLHLADQIAEAEAWDEMDGVALNAELCESKSCCPPPCGLQCRITHCCSL
jgi:hypothetical protein